MKVEGIDHVYIQVKDIDKAVQFFEKLFDMEFEELPGAETRRMRTAISRPDGQLEFMSVVDPAKAPPRASAREEGLAFIMFRVNDADEAIADAERKGVRVDRIHEEHHLTDFIPHFKEIALNEEDMPFSWPCLIWRDTK